LTMYIVLWCFNSVLSVTEIILSQDVCSTTVWYSVKMAKHVSDILCRLLDP